MAKDYNEISNQSAVVKVDGRTLAFYPNLEVPDVNKYGEGMQGKVKVTINDYSEGKGDNVTLRRICGDFKTARHILTEIQYGFTCGCYDNILYTEPFLLFYVFSLLGDKQCLGVIRCRYRMSIKNGGVSGVVNNTVI